MKRKIWIAWLLWLAGAAFAQFDVRDPYVSSDDAAVSGYAPVTVYSASFPLNLDWEVPGASYQEYTDLGQAVQVGNYYAIQPGAWVEDPDAGWVGDDPAYWYLEITLSQRSASSVAELSSATWTVIGRNLDLYNGGAEPAFVEFAQMTLRYPVADWNHIVMQWKISAFNYSTGYSDSATTNRVYFGSLLAPTPTPTATPVATPAPTPTLAPTPRPVADLWIFYLGGKWHNVRFSP